MQNFCMVLRNDQELRANGMSATVIQIDAVLACFNVKEIDLKLGEEAAVTERQNCTA